MEIRRSYDPLISTMGFPILIRRHLYIESGPWTPVCPCWHILVRVATNTTWVQLNIFYGQKFLLMRGTTRKYLIRVIWEQKWLAHSLQVSLYSHLHTFECGKGVWLFRYLSQQKIQEFIIAVTCLAYHSRRLLQQKCNIVVDDSELL